MDPISINVETESGTYPIYIGRGVTTRLADILESIGIGKRRFVVSSRPIWKLHGQTLSTVLPEVEPILIPDGERFKTLATVGRIYESLIKARADRASTIIALGGGLVGDVAGFTAATFLRGVTLVQLPTTLLAQVDSSIGGKVGVNHSLGKNLIGAFHPPITVVIDPQWLTTLPRRELSSGLYEVIKYGMISNQKLFDLLRREVTAVFAQDQEILTSIIVDSCQIKASVVSTDEREQGLRRILNFGHTAGHALESVTNYRRFCHGEAVAYGMLVAASIGVTRNIFDKTDYETLAETIALLGPLPPINDLSASKILEGIWRDKKIISGKLHYVLPTAIGKTVLVGDVTGKEIEQALKQVGATG